ncbi:hypothetical protein KSS94_04625 [Pseudomonas fakonensis]|uniref:Uncharacterized protein n=1 Tax=Pseudomonas fakonensis TaxID=2842355 RepID=A0ABX8N7T7_9PSED|nr:hypothetical protein [Pseudomonas fakonensis]QXH52419.1 hypothetical protein KSS94_04625 [Pseudomonas fakonensis]
MLENIRSNGLTPGVSSPSGVQRVAGSLDTKANEALQGEQEGPELSSLAKQLNAAAGRAAQRDANLTRNELAALARDVLEKLSGGSYLLAKSSHDAYRPATDDPELLLRAQQATDFANGKGSNPFASLSHEQLSLITYDESGDFTVNERRAASAELGARHGKWTQSVVHDIEKERQRTGSIDQGISQILSYYKSLPAIEEAQLPLNYEMNLSLQASGAEADSPAFIASLFAMLAEQWAPGGESGDSQRPQPPDSSPSGELG